MVTHLFWEQAHESSILSTRTTEGAGAWRANGPENRRSERMGVRFLRPLPFIPSNLSKFGH